MRKPLAILSILSMTMLFAACNTAPVDEETDTEDAEMTDEMEPVMTDEDAEMTDEDVMTDEDAEMTDEEVEVTEEVEA